MAQKTIRLGLEFDTKAAIQSYRNLISEMSKGGADPRAIKQFTAEIEKAETELAQLAAEGSTGFKDSKSIEQYQKKVLKVTTAMQQLALRMQEFSKSGNNFPTSSVKKLGDEIEKLKKKIAETQKAAKEGLTKTLTDKGFSKKDAESIAEIVKNESELIAKLEEERKLRAAIRDEAKKTADAAKGEALRKADARITAKSDIVTNATGMQGKKGVTDARVAVAEAIKQGLREGFSGEDVRKRAIQLIEATGLDEKLKQKITKGLEEGFNVEAVDNYIKDIRSKIDAMPAVKKYNTASESYNKIANGTALRTEDYSQFITQTQQLAQAQNELSVKQGQAASAASASETAQRRCGEAAAQEAVKTEQAANSFMRMSDAQKDSLKSTEELESGFNRLTDRFKYMFGFTAMFNKLRQIIRSTFNDIQALDKAYASIAYVTNETVADLWSTYSEYAGMAEKLGQSTQDVIKASAIYRQQGLDTAEALELTTDTMKLATIAGNDYSTATQEMTAALRGFKMEMNEGSHVSDVYSELAAHAAAKVDDIAQAMSRTASIANSAGMSFENTSAFLTQMIETTQESAENIGTSMKTIIARFTELKKNIAGTDESEFDDLDFNKVDTALKSVGVSLTDTQHQFRNLDDVFLELSEKWATLDRNTQRYIATVAAGSRQQSRFIALMDNYERTTELINIAADSEGKADEQFAKAADTIEFKLNAIKTKWEEFKLSIMSSDFVKRLLDLGNNFMDSIKNIKMPQLAIGLTVAIPTIKKFILSIVNAIKTGTKQFQSLGAIVSDSITRGMSRHPVRLVAQLAADQAQLQQLEQQKTKIEQKLANNPINLIPNIDQTSLNMLQRLTEIQRNSGVDNFEERIRPVETWAEALKGCGVAAGDLIPMLERLATEEGVTAKSIRDALNELRGQKGELVTIGNNIDSVTRSMQMTQQQINGLKSGLATVGSAMTIFATSMFSGVSAADSFKASTSMLITALMSLAFKAIPQVVTAIKTGSAEATAALSATGWGALIVGIGLALSLLGQVVTKSIEAKKQMTDAYQLGLKVDKLNALKSKSSEQNSELDSRKEELKTTTEMLDRFKELSNVQIKTTEEQEEYNNLVDEIRNNYPTLIESYKEVTNQLEIQEDKAQKILDTQKEQVIAQQKLKAATDYTMAATNISKTNLEYSLDTDSNRKISEYLFGSIGYNIAAESTRRTGWSITQDADFAGLVSNELKAGQSNEDAIKNALGLTGIDLQTFLKTVGYDSANLTEDQWKTLTNSLLDTSTGIYTQISKNNIEILKLKKEERDSTIAYYKQMEEEAIKASLGASYENLDDFVLGEIAKYSTTGAASSKMSQGADGVDEMLADLKNGKPLIDNLKSWNELSSDVRAIWERVGASYGEENIPKWYAEIAKDDETYKGYAEDFEAQMNQYFSEKFGEEMAQALEGNEDLNKKMQELGAQITEGQITSISDETLNDILSEIPDNDPNGKYLRDMIKAIIDNYNQELQAKKDSLAATLETDLSGWTDAQIQGYQQFIDKTIEAFGGEGGRTAAEDYIRSFKDLLGKELSIDDMLAIYNSLDFSEANAYNWEQFKENGIETIKSIVGLSENESRILFAKLANLAKKSGVYQDALSVGDIQTVKEQISAREELIEKHKDILGKILDTNKPLKLTQKEISSLKKTVDDLGKAGIKIDLSKYLHGDTIAAQEFNEVLTSGLLVSLAAIDRAIQAAKKNGSSKEDIEALEEMREIAAAFNTSLPETFENWDRLDASVNDLSDSLEKVDNVMTQFIKDGQVNAESLAIINSLLDDENDLYKYVDNNLQLNVAGLKQLIHTELEDIKVKYAHGEATAYQVLKLAALERQISNTEKEWTKQTESVEKDHKKAMEDYAKAQQDVIDKQKALNDAIEEYNKLLGGSNNRQSGLDLLYNYKQAISALSDEMARAQDLLDNATSVSESNNALANYSRAAHQRLAYMRAQDSRYAEGLNARRNQLLGGSTSYTNELTGQTTTINFSDYVRYNTDTGLMMINQRLIQDAKIADEWKDYIEKQVDDYNKIASESLKNLDEITKLEREIQKRREESIKKYADFEKDIAETLKERYQEQVNDLKNKYDAMKEADDDYVNALQEAIEKQRKLRERENKWEDLAQKQKKLSLMRRDTSGTNAIETQKLEKEIQKDREQLLDESIDSVVENMQKLTEKQDELRQTEIELKEALLENTAYWNQQAEGIAQGFQTAEDYVEWFKRTATGLNEQTGKQFEVTMNEARDKFQNASEEISWQIQDDMAMTGDAVTDIINVTAEDIKTIIATTSDTFVDEVINTFERTKASFNDNMDQAIEKVRNAQDALQDAIDKLNEAAQAAQEAADAMANAGYHQQAAYQPPQPIYIPGNTDTNSGSGNTEAARGISNYLATLDNFADKADYLDYIYRNYDESIRSMVDVGTTGAERDLLEIILNGTGAVTANARTASDVYSYLRNHKDELMPRARSWREGMSSNIPYITAQFAKGGLVDFTGPAWVDGTSDRPEAFLSAEDTERIGNAAKLLSNIPSLTRANVSTSNQTYGDTQIEINLNIDHLSSDVDVDEMIERVKQEIVEVARPVGTNVILQQQV